jgi:hypothetical protein
MAGEGDIVRERPEVVAAPEHLGRDERWCEDVPRRPERAELRIAGRNTKERQRLSGSAACPASTAPMS